MNKLLANNYHQLMRRRWSTVALITLVFVVLSLAVTLAQPFRYESEVKILVIQKSAISIDAYSASKSAERIGNNLSQIIYSSSFFNKVLSSGFAVNSSYFVAEEEKRREQWHQMIDASVPAGTTILDVKVYHQDRDQATIVAQAIAYVLGRQTSEYIGVADVELKVVDAPLTSKYPVKPNLILNIGLGLVLGFLIAMAYLVITYSDEHESKEVFQEKHAKAQEVKESYWDKRRRKKEVKQHEKKIRLAEKEAVMRQRAEKKQIAAAIPMPVPESKVEHIEKKEELGLPDMQSLMAEEELDEAPVINHAAQVVHHHEPKLESLNKVEEKKDFSLSDLPAFKDEDIKTMFDK